MSYLQRTSPVSLFQLLVLSLILFDILAENITMDFVMYLTLTKNDTTFFRCCFFHSHGHILFVGFHLFNVMIGNFQWPSAVSWNWNSVDTGPHRSTAYCIFRIYNLCLFF